MSVMPRAVGDTAPVARRFTHMVVGLALSGVVLGAWVLAVTASGRDETSTSTQFSAAVGVAYLASGVLAHRRQPANRVGLLMVLVGIAWFAEDIQISVDPVVHTTGLFTRAILSGFLVNLVLAFPSGELRTWIDRTLTATAYAAALIVTPATVFFLRTLTPNLLLIADATSVLKTVFGVLQAIVAAALTLVLANRWRVATRPARRVLAPVYLTGLVGAVSSIVHPIFWWDNRWGTVVLNTVEHAATLLLPVAFLAGVWRIRLGRTAVADLVVRLPDSTPETLRELLAHALGDPELRVGYFRPESADYVDHNGLPLRLSPGRELTPVRRNGRLVAALVHDPAIREDRHVLAAVIAAAAAELDNQRLAAEVRAQLNEVRASRARIVAAGDEQRRRVERDLHDGAQQRLVTLALTLRLAQQRLTTLAQPDPQLADLLELGVTGLQEALAELRVLAQGIHPAVLTEAGLLPALRALAARSPNPVELHESPVPPLRPPVEATAYYVAAEAVTNALKHAAADTIRIEVWHDDGGLHVVVTDDGAGGADMAAGSGLLGLRDRVSAVDGTLTVHSPPGGGTFVHAVLPVSQS